MAERRAVRRLHRSMDRLNGYIQRVSQRTGWRSILFGAEDIAQECAIVLWKVITKYPDAKGADLIKLFKRSMIRHLASIFRLEHVKRSMGTIQFSSIGGKQDRHHDEEAGDGFLIAEDYSVLPWDYYQSQFRIIERRIGKQRLKAMVKQRNFGKSFPHRKEAILKSVEC